MNSNRHPVDRLADVRDQIARLKRQEAQLRDQILDLSPGAVVAGDTHEAQIKRGVRRAFQKDLLPPQTLAQPHLWRSLPSTIVTVRPREARNPPPLILQAEDDIVLVEDF